MQFNTSVGGKGESQPYYLPQVEEEVEISDNTAIISVPPPRFRPGDPAYILHDFNRVKPVHWRTDRLLNLLMCFIFLTINLCVYVEADSISGPDTEDLLCDSTEYLGGAPTSGPHRPLLSAGGEESPGSWTAAQKLRKNPARNAYSPRALLSFWTTLLSVPCHQLWGHIYRVINPIVQFQSPCKYWTEVNFVLFWQCISCKGFFILLLSLKWPVIYNSSLLSCFASSLAPTAATWCTRTWLWLSASMISGLWVSTFVGCVIERKHTGCSLVPACQVWIH